MKNISLSVFTVFLALVLASCLEYGLEPLPVFEEADITAMSFEYRKANEGNYDIVALENTININKDAAMITNELKVLSSVSAENKEKISLSNLVAIASISAAASISPNDGAPVLGTIGDFSVPRKYTVTAANGTTKVWTIITTLTK